MIQIYHNPRCGKSRNCLAFVEDTKQEYEIIPYLTETPSFDDLKELLKKLNLKPAELVRTKEKIWIENYKGKNLTEDETIQAMVDNPILIERPIVVKDGKAIIGRDLDKVASFLD
ncbi:arsenate reductase (glutaredoxin) [Flavobacterium johnsoniae]|uniref:Arsenate reductase n=1 Tax=Flavobacterium johnsoniae (strain ATCC 17061 / DSM 2064 / JCM 8514 / BCRC 14874 / CCUG 350202 / NBRC 14942 / NCIMB 11054 / UW101) TaxID=376686 RepID=A5FAI9_FLAJ1|nr:arsenate reductase (glutaredoxin) [Flavobacterium johnsoniae]ABQ07783.1 arsenate reductase [Flavobacterium johnsoniae UW101]OXG01866.1 arsenate reductase (glutaredoxin) [Flavobacterium johnsoniae UW101]WQG80375.1 arsenate reductase (glutaredoxin) [Flavobacterium johnsoniae UW101]SHL02134.1 arsenate reductase [Flavobacterium johnsoniae]